jgi:signal transduction histidine kinase
VVLAMMAADVLFALLSYGVLPAPGLHLGAAAVIILIGAAALVSMRSGQIYPTISWWLMAQWFHLILSVLTEGGVRSVYVSSFIVLVLIAGLLLELRRFIRFAWLGLITVVGVMLVEASGLTVPRSSVISPAYFWLGLLINLALVCLLLYFYGRSLRYSLERSRRELLERRAAESALRQSEQRYRNFIEHSFEGVWLVEFDEPIPLDLDPDLQVHLIHTTGYIAECNEAVAGMLGFASRADLFGKRLTEVFGLQPDPRYLQVIQELVQYDYARHDREVRGANRFGQPMYFLVNTIGVIEYDCLVSVWVSQRDVTARRNMQQALQRRNEQLGTLNLINTAILSLRDLNGVLMEVLARMKEILPLDVFYVALYDADTDRLYYPLVYDSDVFWAVPPGPFAAEGWLGKVLQHGETLLINRTPEEIERLQNATDAPRIGNTSRVSASMLAAPLKVGARQIGVMSVQSYSLNAYEPEQLEFLALASLQVAVAIDNARLYESLQVELAERQKAEAALSELNAELEQRVQDRTAQVEAAMHELESFSYSVSHDLRAPLRAIDGYSRFLMEDYASRLDDEGLLFLENVRKAAQRMGVLIDDLLNLSRVSRLELRLQPVSLSDLAADIGQVMRSREPNRPIHIEIQPDLTVIGDAHLLRLVLENLMENAWKFTSREPEPSIEFGVQEGDDGRAFYVRDNGAGFDMRYAAKLFKPFSRLHGVEEFEGTGIGLANVRRVIDRHGGRVWAEAALGQGACFYFTIPDQPIIPENGSVS